jgi:putative intracellular protease/amidase
MKLVRFAVAVGLAVLGASARSFAADAGKKYHCSPCAMPCDSKTFDAAGTCPDCGAPLVSQDDGSTVVILLFPGVEIIDYTGPYEVFGQAGFEVFTVAESKSPITTAMGMTVVPRFAFSDCPKPDVLVVPGGNVASATGSETTVQWVKEQAGRAGSVLSVCNGAFILAKAGLLDGLSATTFHGLIDSLKRDAPKTKVVSDQRFVDNGKIVTAAGLSSGIDGALHVVEKLRGHGFAQSCALGLEYDWRPDAGWARAALADSRIPDLPFLRATPHRVLRTEGTRERWDAEVEVDSEEEPASLLGRVDRDLETTGKWARVGGKPVGGKSEWTFADADGARWSASSWVKASDTASAKRRILGFHVQRVS